MPSPALVTARLLVNTPAGSEAICGLPTKISAFFWPLLDVVFVCSTELCTTEWNETCNETLGTMLVCGRVDQSKPGSLLRRQGQTYIEAHCCWYVRVASLAGPKEY